MAVFVISQQILTNIAQINAKAKDNYLREFVKICQLTFLSFYGVMEYWSFFSSSSNSFTPLLRRDFERICENLLTKNSFTPLLRRDFWENLCEFGYAELKVVWLTLGDWLNRSFGLTEPLLWIDWTVPLDSTSCRRLAIATASARRCDGEGSPCKRWGLGISVKSKERFSGINGKMGFRRTKGSVKSKKRFT